MTRPLVPRDCKTTRAIDDANAKPPLMSFKVLRCGVPTHAGKQIPAFNGSGINRRNKKRPITLADKA